MAPVSLRELTTGGLAMVRSDILLPMSEKAALTVDTPSWSVLEPVNLVRGFIKGGFEDPVNGVSQIVNSAFGTKIPELRLVDEGKATQSKGGIVGHTLGKALDFAALSLATKNIAVPSSSLGAVLRGGAIGALYGGVFTPTDAASESFMADRMKNAAISFATFAAMGYAGAKIDSTGIFAVPEARSFIPSLAYGALTGVAGGAAYSQADALLNKGRLVPTLDDFSANVNSWALFGAVMGGATFGYHRHNVRVVEAKTTPGSDGSKVDVRMEIDASGRPVAITQHFEFKNDRYPHAWHSVLKTDGTWASKGYGSRFATPELNGVTFDTKGMITTLDDRGNRRYYKDGSSFDSDRLIAGRLADVHAKAGAPTTYEQVGYKAEKRAFDNIKLTNNGWVENDKSGSLVSTVRTDSPLGYRRFSAQGQIEEVRLDWKPKPDPYPKNVGDLNASWADYSRFRYNADGSLQNVMLRTKDNVYLSATQKEAGVWDLSRTIKAVTVSKFEGQLKVPASSDFNAFPKLEIIGKDGVRSFVPVNDPTKIAELITRNAAFEPFKI